VVLLTKPDERRREGTEGVTSIEYAMIASLIAMAIIATVSLLGVGLNDLYDDVLQAVIDSNS
jgi:Flp pilus assembly pilin Flp